MTDVGRWQRKSEDHILPKRIAGVRKKNVAQNFPQVLEKKIEDGCRRMPSD